MPIPDSLRPICEALQAVRADAARELQDLYGRFPDQAELLSKWLGQDVPGAVKQLENIANKGADAIPDGLRQDVVDAYNKLAQIVADAAPALKPWVDPDGVQALRAELKYGYAGVSTDDQNL